jgi:hypothetical protein
MAPTLNRRFARHAKDHAELSATPEHFKTFAEDVSLMGGRNRTISRTTLRGSACPW